MRKVLVVGIIVMFLVVAVAPLTQSIVIEKSNHKYKELDSLLNFHGLNTDNTMGDFEQLLYNLVNKRSKRNPTITAELINDIEKLSDIMNKIGVTDDMKIAEAIPIIENNKEQLQEEGINLFCSIHVDAKGGYCYPFFRLFQVLFGNWHCWGGPLHTHHYVKIKSQIVGLQYCEDYECGNKSGDFIGLIGFNPPVMYYIPYITDPIVYIRGNFSLFSRSDVPFVGSDGNLLQSKCPCNKQISR